jgi:thioredoxin reductase (NADPH)
MNSTPSRLAPIQRLAAQAPAHDTPLQVIALCAEWCGTCREFRPMLQRLADGRPAIVFAWADVEDDAELVGDLDVDNFPTLAVFRAGVVLHYGVSLPQEGVVARMIDALASAPLKPAADVPVEVLALARRLARSPGD